MVAMFVDVDKFSKELGTALAFWDHVRRQGNPNEKNHGQVTKQDKNDREGLRRASPGFASLRQP